MKTLYRHAGNFGYVLKGCHNGQFQHCSMNELVIHFLLCFISRLIYQYKRDFLLLIVHKCI